MQLFMRVLVSQILDNKSGECKVSQPQPQYDILDVKKPHAAPCHVLYLLWHSSVINFALLSSLPLLSSPLPACLLACLPGLTQGPGGTVLQSQHRGVPGERGGAL